LCAEVSAPIALTSWTRTAERVKSGWDPTARPEADELRCGQTNF